MGKTSNRFILAGLRNGRWVEADATAPQEGETDDDAIEFLKTVERSTHVFYEDTKILPETEFVKLQEGGPKIGKSPEGYDENNAKFDRWRRNASAQSPDEAFVRNYTHRSGKIISHQFGGADSASDYFMKYDDVKTKLIQAIERRGYSVEFGTAGDDTFELKDARGQVVEKDEADDEAVDHLAGMLKMVTSERDMILGGRPNEQIVARKADPVHEMAVHLLRRYQKFNPTVWKVDWEENLGSLKAVLNGTDLQKAEPPEDYGYKLDEVQLEILKEHRPGSIRGDRYIDGDDNDLACVFSSIAEKVRHETGDIKTAYKIDSAAPKGFFHCTWEKYVRTHLKHLPYFAAVIETKPTGECRQVGKERRTLAAALIDARAVVKPTPGETVFVSLYDRRMGPVKVLVDYDLAGRMQQNHGVRPNDLAHVPGFDRWLAVVNQTLAEAGNPLIIDDFSDPEAYSAALEEGFSEDPSDAGARTYALGCTESCEVSDEESAEEGMTP